MRPLPIRLALASTLALLMLPALAGAQPAPSQEPIRYTLRFPAPHTHYVEVEASFPTAGQPQIDVMMAVWTPGSYLVREYEKNVENISARTRDGGALAIEKTLKNRWRIRTNGAPAVAVAYRVYCREMGVRSNWVEDGFAMLNGAATFITLADQRPHVHEVNVELPPAWHRVMTAMPDAPDGGGVRFRAPDFDTLVDSPMVIGNPAVYEFTVDGKRHFLVNTGEGGVWDGAAIARDLEKIVQQARTLWGSLPYDKYLFLNMITESGGGIEHKGSTMLMSSRWATRTHRGYLGFLRLASHEYFHAWNVKRLRPIELGPFDYEHEVYPKGLWVSEGFTDYYGALQLWRAGLQTRDEFLEELSGFIQTLQTRPGRLTQSVEMSSFDAWIKEYRPDENSINSSISYYTKGSVIAFVLDAKIRNATQGARTLDDLMRTMYQRYSGARGFTEDQFRATAQEIAGTDLSAWFTRTLQTTEELDYAEALDWFGLRFRQHDELTGKAWLGATTRSDAGREVVTQVRRGTPAYAAGLDAEDEILAIGDFRLRAGQLATRLEQYKPGDSVSVLIARRDELKRVDVVLGNEPSPTSWRLDVSPDATSDQKAHFTGWVG
jgi:predicted metalloprotease with PDZ domain